MSRARASTRLRPRKISCPSRPSALDSHSVGRSSRHLGGVAAIAMMAAVLLVPASAPAQVIGFTSGVTAGEVTSPHGDPLGAHGPPGVRRLAGLQGPEVPWPGPATEPPGDTSEQQHGPDAVRRLRAEHHLLLPVLLPGREEVQRVRQVRDRAGPQRSEDDPVRVFRRRDGPSRHRGRPSPSTAPSRPSRRWPPRTTTSTSTSGTRSTRTPRSQACRPLRRRAEVGVLPEEAVGREHADDPRGHRPLQPLGRPRVHQRLLDPRGRTRAV